MVHGIQLTNFICSFIHSPSLHLINICDAIHAWTLEHSGEQEQALCASGASQPHEGAAGGGLVWIG